MFIRTFHLISVFYRINYSYFHVLFIFYDFKYKTKYHFCAGCQIKCTCVEIWDFMLYCTKYKANVGVK